MNRRRNTAWILTSLLVLFTSLWSCTKVDNTVGNSFIPNDQQMRIYHDTVSGIEAYVALVDSFPLNFSGYSWYYGCIGAMHDETFGGLESGWLGQYGGLGFYITNEDEDVDATDEFIQAQPDSLTLYLAFDASVCDGDTSKTQTFNVYEVTKRLYVDSLYYIRQFNVDEVIDPEPLFTFDYKLSDGNPIELRMTGAKVEDLMDRLQHASRSIYEADSLFVDEFKGLYIAPSATSPRDAAVLSVATTSTSLYFYTHKDYLDDSNTEQRDTIIGSYSFDASTYTDLLSLNTYQFDYNSSKLDQTQFNDTLSAPVSVSYVQGCGGVTTYLKFTEDFANQLKSLKDKDPRTTSMVIHSARLEIGLADPTPENLDMAMSRLGLYTDYRFFLPISDYLYSMEVSETNPITLAYGGYVNRSRNSYTMDITRMVQIIADIAPQDYMIDLGPSFFEAFNPTHRVILSTPTDASDPLPLRVSVTYTLVRRPE